MELRLRKTLRKIGSFRDRWLAQFFEYGTPNRKIPPELEPVLAGKLDMLNAAGDYRDLRSPPGNRLETLEPPLQGYDSIRVNNQYRLVFAWINGKSEGVYLDSHQYARHR